MTCRPDIGYAITLSSKFGLCPLEYHYTCVKNVESHEGLGHPILQTYKESWQLVGKIWAARRTATSRQTPSIPRINHNWKTYMFCGLSRCKWCCKTKMNDGIPIHILRGCSSLQIKDSIFDRPQLHRSWIYCSSDRCKDSKIIWSVLCKLGLKQTDLMQIYKGNKPMIDIVSSQKPTEQTRHINICLFAIQDSIHKSRDVLLLHIPVVINPLDNLTKPLGRVLHERHARYITGHYNIIWKHVIVAIQI